MDSLISLLQPPLIVTSHDSGSLLLGLRLGICTGRVACIGVRPGWAWARPWAEISLPEHRLCPCLGLLRVYGFFFTHIESPQRFSKWWIAFRLPCPLSSTLSCISSVFPSWRLQNCAVFHVFSSAIGHLSSWRLLRLRKTLHL